MGRPPKGAVAAAKADGTTIDLGQLNAKQAQFLKSKALYCGYGGARGGGKSHAVRIDAIRGALQYNGIKILIVRRRYTDLQGNYVEPLNRMLPSTIAEYNSQLHQYYFINGSTIKLGHFQSYSQAADEYQGQDQRQDQGKQSFLHRGMLLSCWLSPLYPSLPGFARKNHP